MIELIDELIWSYAAVPILLMMGIFLTFKHRFAQWRLVKSFFSSCAHEDQENKKQDTNESAEVQKKQTEEVSPWEAFFASLGGCIGIGNVVAVCTAIQVGGPGALIWMHIAAFLGMMIKYSEVFVSIKTRVSQAGEYYGGPFIYLRSEKCTILGTLFAVLLAIYSVDVYMFKVVVDTAAQTLPLPEFALFFVIYLPLLFSAQKGIKLVGLICSYLIPLFLIIFLLLSFGVLYHCSDNIYPSIVSIFSQAFGLAPVVGGAAGASVMLTISEGIKRGCYSGDIGVGYAGLVHAKATYPRAQYQASYEIIGVLIDTFLVCTLSTFVIIVADTYKLPLEASVVLQHTMSQYFPAMHIFFPLMIILLGYSTLLTFFYVGRECSIFVFKQYGSMLYSIYSFCIFAIFLYLDQQKALAFMSIIGALLLLLNCYGLLINRDLIKVENKEL